MADTTVKTTAAAAPPDDAADLAAKLLLLGTVTAELQDASGRSDTLKAEIKVLEARIAEVKKATDGYTAAAASEQQELDADVKLIEQKGSMASAAVKDQQKAIDAIVQGVDDDISGQGKNIRTLQTGVDNAQQDSDAAAADWKAKADAYNGLKQTQKNIDDQLKQIKALIDQAAKAESQNDVVSMYFLLEEASAAAKAVTILTPDDYTAALKAAQAAVESSKTDSTTKKADLDAKSKVLADAKAQLSAAVASRRATILTKLKAIKPSAPAAGGVSAAAGAGPVPAPSPAPAPAATHPGGAH